MSERLVDLGPAASRVADLVRSVGEDDLTRPTPCPAYSVGDLVDHIGDLALAFRYAAQKDGRYAGGNRPGNAANLTDDWRQRIPRDLELLVEAWREPDAWAGMTRIAGMDSPGEMVGLTVSDELVVHGWDLARATRQPYEGDPAVAEAARTFLTMFASTDAAAGPTVAFGPSRAVADDAPLLDRVVALAGRDPSWAAPTG
jgi:uncharacterized protein (TIGR03086 family)